MDLRSWSFLPKICPKAILQSLIIDRIGVMTGRNCVLEVVVNILSPR